MTTLEAATTYRLLATASQKPNSQNITRTTPQHTAPGRHLKEPSGACVEGLHQQSWQVVTLATPISYVLLEPSGSCQCHRFHPYTCQCMPLVVGVGGFSRRSTTERETRHKHTNNERELQRMHTAAATITVSGRPTCHTETMHRYG